MAKKKNKQAENPFPDALPPATRNGKMSIYEYEQKYVKRQNVRGAKFFLRFFTVALGIILFAVLFFVAKQVYDINEYAGYGAAAVCLLLYIFLFIVPTVKIFRTPAFRTNVNAKTAKDAQKHNKKLRRAISEKIIDLTAKVEGVGWYDSGTVGELAIAVQTNDDEKIKKNLTALYTGSVKKSAKELIFKSSLKSAAYSAISQSAKIDAMLIVFLNMQLVKDIVFLYGFRPSDARLAKIFAHVLQNSLIAYGLGGLNIGNTVAKTMGNAVRGIPILGSAIAAIVDSSVQGLANGTLTTVIGYQTIRYLNTEYRLQNILDGVDVSESEEELREACNDLEDRLKKDKKFAPAV